MRKKFCVLIVCLLLASQILMAGGEQESTEGQPTIVMVSKALDNPIYVDAIDSAEKVAKELDIKFEYTASTKSDAIEQVSVVESLIERHVDGILIAPNDPDALADVINTAIECGIKVGCFDSDSPESDRLFYVGTNNYQLGVDCANEMIRLTSGKGKLAIQTGVVGAFNLEERIRGFKDTIKDTDLEIVTLQANNESIEKSVELIETYTAAHPELDAWWVDGGWPFFVSIEALPKLKEFRENGKVFVIIDTFYPMLKFMKEDPPFANIMIGQNYSAMGDIGIRKLYDLIKGKDDGQDIIYTPMETATKDNIDSLYAGKVAWGD